MKALLYSGIKNRGYTPSREIGKGGEGSVYEVQEDSSLVIKIYNEILEKDKIDKLIYMASMANGNLTQFAAWPLDVVKDTSLKVSGFIMKKLDSFVPLHMLFSPMERKKIFPDKGYNFLVHVAKNLATAFYKIHEFGVVIGDVNEANVLVNKDGIVALIDCDSFQIKNGNHYHFCEVGIPRYTPPELLERGSFGNAIRTTNTDSFSLATLIFQLLFLGRAPFTGINSTNEEIDEEKAIKTNEFAYSLKRTTKKLNPAKNSLLLKYFPPGIVNSFHSAFESRDKRPLPKQWIIELDTLYKEIIPCNKSKIHQYSKTMQRCPWCFFEDNVGITYFLDDTYLKSTLDLTNIDQFINGFKLDKIEIKKLNEDYFTPNLSPSPIDKKFYSLKNQKLIVNSIAILITICAGLFYSWVSIIFGVLFILMFNNLSTANKKINEELLNRQVAFDTLKVNFLSLIKQHNYPPEFNTYNNSANKLTELISVFKKLPAEFTFKKNKIEEKHYNLKLTVFLQQFEVLYYPIPSFGATKKRLIYNNGIRTAADIAKLNNVKINGIGPANIQILFNWQRQLQTGFTYIRDLNVINQEVNRVAQEISSKRKNLELNIRNEYNGLMALKANILASTKSLERKYNDLSIKLYQSELDLQEFKKDIKKL